MVRRQRRESQHGTTSRNVSLLEEGLQLFLRITQLYALPYQRQRTLGIVDEFGSTTHGIAIQLGIRHIRADEVYLLGFPVNLLHLRILRKVENDRTRATTTGNIERTADSPRHILSATYLVTPFGDRLRDAHEVNLLEGVGTQCSNGHLSGNDDDRR